MRDWWDRTEAQQRGSLHNHILCWFVPRERKPDYAPLRPVARTVRGTDSKPRSKEQVVHALGEKEYQEEIVCYMRVHKMSHPLVSPDARATARALGQHIPLPPRRANLV